MIVLKVYSASQSCEAFLLHSSDDPRNNEYADDLQSRVDRALGLAINGQELDAAVSTAFVVDIEVARDFIGRMFAELYAKAQGYGHQK